MSNSDGWYVVKLDNGECSIVLATQLTEKERSREVQAAAERWGPFASEGEAIARRVGLIRAGKCKPA